MIAAVCTWIVFGGGFRYSVSHGNVFTRTSSLSDRSCVDFVGA